MTRLQRTTRWNPRLHLALFAALLWHAGCSLVPSHLHNEANAKIAIQAQSEMAEYAKHSPNMYAAMLTNIDKFKAEEEYLLTELAANSHSALVTKLPTMTWATMRDRAKQNKETIGKFKEQIQAEAEAYLKRRGEVLGQLKSAEEAVAESRKAVLSAKQNVSTWNAYVALLQQGFSNLPDNLDELNKDTGLKALSKAASDVGKQEITFRDADGKRVKSSVAAVLKDQLPSITMMIDQDSKKGARSLPDAPGIALIIMNLGLGLAEIEQQRALTRFSQLNARAVLFEDALAAMELAEKLLAEVSQEIDSAVTENAFADITRLWHEAAELNDNPPQFMLKQNAISNTLVVLRKAANVEAIIARNQSLFQVAVARLEHQDSIVESVIGDAAWQVVIGNGLNGLAAYHQSGFTREDAANVIRIAQTIALGFIAAGTN